MDMKVDVFKETAYGKAALKKMGEVGPNFRLYCAGFIGKSDSMVVDGAEFREAKSGPNKGQLSVRIEGTQKNVVVYQSDMDEFREKK